MPVDWSKLVGPAIGAGAVIGGSLLQGRAANKSSEREWELLQQEMARRNMLQGMIAPQLLHGAGIRNPAQVQQYSRAIGGQSPAIGSQPSGSGGMVPSTPTSTTNKVLGGVGTGLGVASMLPAAGVVAGNSGVGSLAAQGLGALGIGGAAVPFIGPAILGASLVASQIGKGRRTANTLTNPETGPEGQLVAVLRNPNATAADVQQAHNNYQQAIQAFRAAGGNQRKVAEQSLANQPLQQTIAARLRELGLG